MLDGLDPHVAGDFDAALRRISKAGAVITRAPLPVLERIAEMIAKGGLSAAESYAWHRKLIATRGNEYDPRVRTRILRGAEQAAADYIEFSSAARAAITAYDAATIDYDAIIMPTAAIVAPRIADAKNDDDYIRINMLMLRNTMMFNMLDGCSISMPMNRPGDAPTSLMVSGAAAPIGACSRFPGRSRGLGTVLAAGRAIEGPIRESPGQQSD